MIEINLLPKELKTKGKKIYTQPKYLLYLALSFLGILIVTHIVLFLAGIILGFNLNVLNNRWHRLSPQRQILEDFKKTYDTFSSDTGLIQQLVKQRINWSEKLNRLSSNLPAGIWFNDIEFNPKGLSLKGSAISLQKEEMNLINRFIENLKNERDFFKDFSNLELTSVQRRAIGGYEVVDFVLSGKLK